MTTTDIQKQNAVKVLQAVIEFRKTQNEWNKLNITEAPKELRKPVWNELKSASKGLAIELDIGEVTEKLRGAMYVVRQYAITQVIEGKLLTWKERNAMSNALQIAESELRTIADIKQKPFVDRIAEKVAKMKTNSSTESTSIKAISPSAMRAAASYEWVCRVRSDLVPKSSRKKYTTEMHEFIKQNDCPAYESDDGGPMDVPEFETWKRQVRAGLADPSQPKASARAGRPHGKSIQEINQI